MAGETVGPLAATVENSIELKTELPYNPGTPLLGIRLKTMKTLT